jgi:hypothetical protein
VREEFTSPTRDFGIGGSTRRSVRGAFVAEREFEFEFAIALAFEGFVEAAADDRGFGKPDTSLFGFTDGSRLSFGLVDNLGATGDDVALGLSRTTGAERGAGRGGVVSGAFFPNIRPQKPGCGCLAACAEGALGGNDRGAGRSRVEGAGIGREAGGAAARDGAGALERGGELGRLNVGAFGRVDRLGLRGLLLPPELRGDELRDDEDGERELEPDREPPPPPPPPRF